MTSKQFWTFTVLTCSLFSCDDASQTTTQPSIIAPHGDSSHTPLAQQSDLPAEIQNDSIVYDTLIFPNDTVYPGEMLLTGIFHAEEVRPGTGSKNWYGLFTNGKDFYLSATKIETKRVYDPIVDEDSLKDRSGWEVTANHKDTALYLFSGINSLKARTIVSVSIPKREILPGDDTVKIFYNGNLYKLYADGNKQLVSKEPDWYKVWNYKLYLATTKNGKTMTELIVAAPYFDDAMTNILFIADMDGDGFLDFIIDTSAHYNSSVPTLYLSKPAGKIRLLKVMAQHVSVGC